MFMILRWILFTLAVMLVAYIIPGITVEGFMAAFILSVVIGLINVFLRPLLTFITLPINFLTLGLFGLILNALLLMLAGYIAPGVTIEGFWPALWGSLLLGILGGGISLIGDKRNNNI